MGTQGEFKMLRGVSRRADELCMVHSVGAPCGVRPRRRSSTFCPSTTITRHPRIVVPRIVAFGGAPAA